MLQKRISLSPQTHFVRPKIKIWHLVNQLNKVYQLLTFFVTY